MLDRNDSWEKYLELFEKFHGRVARTFYIYKTALGTEDEPCSPGRWLGPEDDRGYRNYYTGATTCVIEDVDGNHFIGSAMCSKSEAFFRKKTGRHVSRYRALQAMDLVHKTFYAGPVKLTPDSVLPKTLRHAAIVGIGKRPDILGVEIVPADVHRKSTARLKNSA